jgi:hypothetical protein
MSAEIFQCPAVRDLAWAIYSPVLLDAAYYAGAFVNNNIIIDDPFCQRLYQQHHAWLSQLDADPQELLAWLAQRRSHRLGYYFEYLIEYWLRHMVGEGFLKTHVPVRRDKQTLGEFDFLFADDSGALQHWEVAVKFYLAHRHDDGRTLFYGPQARDRLDLKVARLLEHQTALAHTREGRDAIEQACAASMHGISPQVSSRILLKGYLFYPVDSDWRSAPLIGAAVSPGHLRGWWTRIDALHIPQRSHASRWRQLPRLHWLAPASVNADDIEDLVPQADLTDYCRAQFARRAEPFLLAELAPDAHGHWREISRGFVVPAHWPQLGDP